MQFILELAKEVTRQVSIHCFKLAAQAGFDGFVGRRRRRKVEGRFGIEMGLWHEYLQDTLARLSRGEMEVGAPPPRILFGEGQDVLKLAADLDEDSRAGLTLARFCMAEMAALAAEGPPQKEWTARVERLASYFDRARALLTPA
jgi:hypothetical protein